MNDINRCPNHELLVTFLYDECEQAERESLAAHLALCASCTEEFQGLRDARVHLAAWSPPALPLGFQMTRTEAEHSSNVLAGPGSRGARGVSEASEGWWRQPLPAWAQAAAAVVIFAAGMSMGAARIDTGESSPQERTALTIPAAATSADLARLDARLRDIEKAQSQLVALPRTASGTVDERAVLARVSEVIDTRLAESEVQNIRRLAGAGRSLEAYRVETAGRLDAVEEWKKDVEQFGGLASYQVSRLR